MRRWLADWFDSGWMHRPGRVMAGCCASAARGWGSRTSPPGQVAVGAGDDGPRTAAKFEQTGVGSDAAISSVHPRPDDVEPCTRDTTSVTTLGDAHR